MRRRCLLAGLGLLAACQGSRVAPFPAVIVAPPALKFPDTYVGGTSALTLDLHSDTAGRLPVTLAAPAPFGVGRSALSVPKGDATVTVSFRPTLAGKFAADLVVTDLAGPTRVHLTGTALPDSDCASRDTCNVRAFDADTGKCTDHSMPDGMDCSNACVSAGQCLEGVCRGPERSCDDGNPCTHDACDADKGCVHSDGTDLVCPVPSDPCQVATCDPVRGCGVAEAADGTDCDASACDLTFTCRAGACVSKPTPEGASCPATPCQDEGVCHNHQCVRAPARTLEPEWTRLAAGNREVDYAGVADDDGNLYYSECTREEAPDIVCDIVSLDYRGRLRWRDRAQSVGQCSDAKPERMMLLDDLLISAESENVIEARNPEDGSIAWRLDVLDAVTNGRLAVWMLDKHYFGVDASPIVDVGDGTMLVFVTAYSTCGPYVTAITSGNWLMGIDVGTGTVKWLQPFDRKQDWDFRIIADEEGRAFFLARQTTRDPSTGQYSTWSTLKAIDGRTGQSLWSVDSALMPLAVASERLMVEDVSNIYASADVYLRDAATDDPIANVLVFTRDGLLSEKPWPLLDDSRFFLWGAQCLDANCQTTTGPPGEQYLVGDVASADIIGSVGFQTSAGSIIYSGALLTTRGALFGVANVGGPNSSYDATEVSRGGRQRFICSLAEPGPHYFPPTLWAGHWSGAGPLYDRVNSYQLGRQVGRLGTGWSSTGGDGKGRNRPR